MAVITDEVRDRAVELVRAGASCRAVAAVLGIHPSTVSRACAAKGMVFAPRRSSPSVSAKITELIAERNLS